VLQNLPKKIRSIIEVPCEKKNIEEMKDFKEKRRKFLFDYYKKTRIAEGIKYFKLLEKKESKE
jgi:hypothetical protein